MPAKITNAEFKNRVKSIVGNEYTFLDDYVSARTSIRVKHNLCGNVYTVAPLAFYAKGRCSYCKRSKHFLEQFRNMVGDEYDVLEDYVDATTKISFRHNKCGYVYKTAPQTFLVGSKHCPKCIIEKRTMSFQEIEEKINKKFKDQFNLLSTRREQQYDHRGHPNGHKLLLTLKCNKCGHSWEAPFVRFIKSKWCPKCYRISQKHTDEWFKEKVKSLVGDEFIFLDKYDGTPNKLRVLHKKCGRIYLQTPNRFLDGDRCRQCSLRQKASRGENYTREWLVDHGYEFIYGYQSPDIVDQFPLHFDFWLEEINTAIEYDGKQHFKAVKIWDGEKGLETRKRHDQMKNEYCKNNGINLIRIRYDEDVDTVLNEKLLQIGSDQQSKQSD